MGRTIIVSNESINVNIYGNEVYQETSYTPSSSLISYLNWLNLRISRYNNLEYSTGGSKVETNTLMSSYTDLSTTTFISIINKSSINRPELFDIEKLAYLSPDTYKQRLTDLLSDFSKTFNDTPESLYGILNSISNNIGGRTDNQFQGLLDSLNELINDLIKVILYLLSLNSVIEDTVYYETLLSSDKTKLRTGIENGTIDLSNLSTIEISTIPFDILTNIVYSSLNTILNTKKGTLINITNTSLEQTIELSLILSMLEDLSREVAWSSNTILLTIELISIQYNILLEDTVTTLIDNNTNMLSSTNKEVLYDVTTSTETSLNKYDNIKEILILIKSMSKISQNISTPNLDTKRNTLESLSLTHSTIVSFTILDSGYNVTKGVEDTNSNISNLNTSIVDNNTVLEDNNIWISNNKSSIIDGSLPIYTIKYHTNIINNSTKSNNDSINKLNSNILMGAALYKSIGSINNNYSDSNSKFLSDISSMNNTLSNSTNILKDTLSGSQNILLVTVAIVPVVILSINGILSNINPSVAPQYQKAMKDDIGSLLNVLVSPLELLMATTNLILCAIKAVLCVAVSAVNLLMDIGGKISSLISSIDAGDALSHLDGFMSDIGNSVKDLLSSSATSNMSSSIQDVIDSMKDGLINALGANGYSDAKVAASKACESIQSSNSLSLSSIISDEVDRVTNELSTSVKNTVSNFNSITDATKCTLDLKLPTIPGIYFNLDFDLPLLDIKLPYFDSKAIKC